MHFVEPKVFVVGETVVNADGLTDYLEHIKAYNSDGDLWASDNENDVEEIIEVMGRSCYKSFGTELNPNITRVRDDPQKYFANLLSSGHGSVLEHGFVNFMFCDVSRVFTHELVRHRPGIAISQESLRYVRIEDLGAWIPPSLEGMEHLFENHWANCEWFYKEVLKLSAAKENVLSFDDLDFVKKKKYTSAARRFLPIGMATNIGWSCNIRSLRHVIEMRTAKSSEEEIQLVFNLVAEMAKQRWPLLFQDFHMESYNYEPVPGDTRKKVETVDHHKV